jgi:hypothetical protein
VRFLQAVADSVARKASILFDARKPLFLRGSHDHPIAHHARSTVVIKSRDT